MGTSDTQPTAIAATDLETSAREGTDSARAPRVGSRPGPEGAARGLTVLVTGGRGQLGMELERVLRTRGVSVYAPGREEVDVTDRTQLQRVLDAVGPDVVFHAAAWTDVDGCERDRARAFRVNAEATAALAHLCAQRGALLVYVSTDYVFDGHKRVPYEPGDPPRPVNVYGESKLAGERAVLEARGPAIIARTSWVYGVFGRNFPKSILRNAAQRCRGTDHGPLRVVDDQIGSPTYAADLAWALADLAGLGDKGSAPFGQGLSGRSVVHVANSGCCSRYEFAQEILRQAGWADKVDVQPCRSRDLTGTAPRPAYSVLGLSRLRAAGIAMRPWQEALGRFLEELREREPALFP